MINLLDAFKKEARFTKKALGQHFLTNGHILNEIVAASGASSGENVIEIGPGCGVLTQLFAETGANVKAVEIDADLAEFLGRYLFYYRNLSIINEDALTARFADFFPGKPVIFAGNLPYNLSVKLFERAALSGAEIKTMVFMFQKEVADRIAAKPNSKIYSSVSVFASYLFEIEKIRDIGGGNFWPNAGVMSTVLKFTPKSARLLPENEEKDFFAFLRKAFVQKRKTLKNNLRDIKNIDDILLSSNLTLKTRAEELSPERFIKLFRNLNA